MSKCRECGGSGICSQCDGSGRIDINMYPSPTYVIGDGSGTSICFVCNGSGKCLECGGTGVDKSDE